MTNTIFICWITIFLNEMCTVNVWIHYKEFKTIYLQWKTIQQPLSSGNEILLMPEAD